MTGKSAKTTWAMLGGGLLAAFAAPGCLWPPRPETLGVHEGRLRACPSTRNCVSTTPGPSGEASAEPLRFSGSAAEAMETLVSVVESMARTQIVTRREDYLHVEFRSRLMRFVDDVEFLIAADQKLIYFRSASRAGYSDLGVNRERMATIARLAAPKLLPAGPTTSAP